MNKILIAGDFGYRGRVADQILTGKGTKLFEDFAESIRKSDYAIVNLESPVGTNSNFISKCGPNICCTPESVQVLSNAGFNVFTLANNHFYDCGQSGVEQTLYACCKYNVQTIGGGRTLDEANRNLILDNNSVKVGVINVCENEFSLATNTHGGSRHLDLTKVYDDIQSLKEAVHHVIIIVHGGHEYYQLPSPRMQDTYRFFIKAGASAVINHHQHCNSGYEIFNDCPIFYGLGNFCFDSARGYRNHIWNKGYLVELAFNTSGLTYEIIPYKQCDVQVGVKRMSNDEEALLLEDIKKLNAIIQDRALLESHFEDFAKKLGTPYFLYPFYNGITAKLYKNSFFRFFKTNRQWMYDLHYIQCESHREALIERIKNIIK